MQINIKKFRNNALVIRNLRKKSLNMLFMGKNPDLYVENL